MPDFFGSPVDLSRAFQGFWKQTAELPFLGTAVVDLQGKFRFASGPFRQIFYHDPSFSPAGFTLRQLEGDAFADEFQTHMQAVVSNGKSTMLRVTRFGTRLELVLGVWSPGVGPNPPAFITLFVREAGSLESGTPGLSVAEMSLNSWGELDQLTDRQLQVLALLRSGLSQREVADQLGVAPKTVEAHRDQLVQRLGQRSTLDAIRLADRAGLTLELARKPRHLERPWLQLRSRGDEGASADPNVA